MSSSRFLADTRPRRCPLAGPAGPVTSGCPRLSPGPGPLPASRPRTSPPRLRHGRHWCQSAPEGRPLAGWEVIRPAHSAARRLAGKLPYYCDAENGETPSRARGAVTVGIPSGGSAAAKVRGSRAGVPGKKAPRRCSRATAAFRGARLSARGFRRGSCGCRALPATTWSPARGEVGARWLQRLRGAGGRRRSCAGAGRARCPSASRAPPWRSRGLPSDQNSPSARKGRKQP